MPSQSEWVSFWHMALAEPLGIYLISPDPINLKSSLYAARARARDPALSHLQIRTAPPALDDPNYPGLGPRNALWIINPPRSED